MDETLRRKLVTYFTSPGDVPASEKFVGWTDKDFEEASKIKELNSPKNYAEYEAFKQKVLQGSL
ncbi:MAG: hypothetical protein E7A81_07935 [Clostridiales bacterium]|uniref:Uncharacterized protein n=1 Tax=Atopobium minutum 10063974 TaxID=997872 RepID=N2BR00_9ACTN|nr:MULTISPECIES: hypothetical protein [Atopobium]EMZ42701.1 hypothetical protein HMPREF1091_00259 [Atopobium minutum 10063974]ERL15274.1 hypothetical protein HMPREF1247_0796 [Atopobium sp. BV3Ac4]MDU0940172.1 hypothetical protein [Clostridiales bacterium]